MTAKEADQPCASHQRWQVGDVTITKFVDCVEAHDLSHIFTDATRDAVLAIDWLKPHFVTPEGLGLLSFHALVVETPDRRIIVDTCWGDGKDRGPWEVRSNLQTRFLQNLEDAGFARESFDTVLCTHLHVDHVGWNTMLVDGKWVPTFPKARYLLDRTEFEFWRNPHDVPNGDGFADVQDLCFLDSVKPVYDAGLIDLVEGTHSVCDEVSLLPTRGHSAGHVSIHISSQGEEAVITGDMTHHPCQLVHPEWGLKEDYDFDQARRTREKLFNDVAERPVLVIGTHWAGVTAGYVRRDGEVYRLEYE